MAIPETPVALLILLIAILPGAFGNVVYQAAFGINWREHLWESCLRLLGFSVFGVALYSVIANWTGLPSALYIFPDTYRTGSFNAATLFELSVAYFGHSVSSGVAGLVGVYTRRGLLSFYPVSPYASAWEDLLRCHVPSHWVAVSLVNGETYVGILERADTAPSYEGRDLLLEEPARYDDGRKNYVSLPYRTLFLPGRLVDSIAVVADPSRDGRITGINESVFEGESG